MVKTLVSHGLGEYDVLTLAPIWLFSKRLFPTDESVIHIMEACTTSTYMNSS